MKHQKFKEATAGMSWAKKREYIWDYYKLHIIAAVCIVAVGIYSYHEFANRREPFLNVVVTVGNRQQQHLSDLEASLNEALLPAYGDHRYTVVVRPMSFNIEEIETANPEEIQAFMLLLAVGETDVLLLDEPSFYHLASIESLMPLDELGMVLDFDLIVDFEGEPMGLRADAFEVLAPIVSGGDFIVAIGPGDDRIQSVRAFLEHALD